MSEDSSQNQTKPSGSTGPVRFRSRFPKAQPNLAVSTGLARIRKISGHFSDAKESDNVDTQTPQSPAPTQTTRQLVDSVLSPKPITHEDEVTKSPMKNIDETHLTIGSPNLTFRQLINNQSAASSPARLTNSISHPGTPFVISNCLQNGSVPVAAYLNNAQTYNPQFSKEHIMNIIKHKAMQKLKKIESENLKEKRKKNKKSSVLYKNVQEQSNLSTEDAVPSQKIDKSKLRMRDFLYYNPRVSKKSESGETIPDATNEQIIDSINRSSSSLSLALYSENDTNDTSESLSSKSSSVNSAIKPVKRPVSLAPQLRISEDGTIVINEESLVIEREQEEPVYESTIVESEHGDNLTYNSYRKFHHTKKWTQKETAKFYKALSMVGTDFTMIQKFFSHRNRDEIKRKFKREEKLNQALIDKILSKTVSIDLSFFVSSSGEDEQLEDNKKKKVKNNSDLNSINGLIEGNTKKKVEKRLKRVQKRAFVESESENESSPVKANVLMNSNVSILVEDKNIDLVTNEIVVETETNENGNDLGRDNLASHIFEGSREFISEQIFQFDDKSELKNTHHDQQSDSESIELVFDLDNQIIDEKRKTDGKESVAEKSKESDSDGEIILDLDNNTIIRSSQIGSSSITITKIDDKKQ